MLCSERCCTSIAQGVCMEALGRAHSVFVPVLILIAALPGGLSGQLPAGPQPPPTRQGIWVSGGLGTGVGEGGVGGLAANLDPRAEFYPEVNYGFFLTGGVGLGFFRFDDSGTAADIGRGFVLGLGYDARIAENISITTFINRIAVHTPDPRGSGIQLGVGLTFH
jgi:hypothetical protein